EIPRVRFDPDRRIIPDEAGVPIKIDERVRKNRRRYGRVMGLIIEESDDACIAEYSVLFHDRDEDRVDHLRVRRITIRIDQIRTVKGEDARTGPSNYESYAEESSTGRGCLSNDHFLEMNLAQSVITASIT